MVNSRKNTYKCNEFPHLMTIFGSHLSLSPRVAVSAALEATATLPPSHWPAAAGTMVLPW